MCLQSCDAGTRPPTAPPPTAFLLYVRSASEKWNAFFYTGASRMSVGWFAPAWVCVSAGKKEKHWIKDVVVVLGLAAVSRGQRSADGQLRDLTFSTWIWQNHHPPFWFLLMCTLALMRLSLWQNNKQPPNRQAVKKANLQRAGRGTFRDFHQITLSSFYCVCYPPLWYFSPPHAANWNHLVFR